MLWWILLAIPMLWVFILVLYAKQIRNAWSEPVLRHPVLIIESDDWGPGPKSHAGSLQRLAELLNAYRDSSGRAPVMTLGLTLSLPDSGAIAASNFTTYHAMPITDPAYADILAAIKTGIKTGVFAPQLHGMAHYWPATLMHAAKEDLAVRNWLSSGPGLETEDLPSHLQSRWIDTRTLPSRALPISAINIAVAEEVTLYRTVFGVTPDVAVPPTFIWTEAVEAAWAANGLHCIVTPGRRCTGRNANGQPDCGPPSIHNNQRGVGDIVYLVRDDYFEPARGHRAEQGLLALAKKAAEGRPCMLETHRNNFTNASENDSLEQLGRLFDLALKQHPDLHFSSASELSQQYRNRDNNWQTNSLFPNLAIWAQRIQGIPRFVKLARLTGFNLFLAILKILGKPSPI